MGMMVQAGAAVAMTDSESDAALLTQFQGGDDQAFMTIFERYECVLIRYLYNLTGNMELAKDFCQETMTRLIQKPPRGRLQGSLRAWLFRVAHNLAMDHLRKANRMADHPQALDEKPDEGIGLHDELTQDKINARLRKHIGELPQPQREILCLRVFGGLRFREVAKAAKLPLGTAIWRMNRAIDSLRESLKEDGWL